MATLARPQLFISHGGNVLSDGFVRRVAIAFRNEGFNVFIDSDERRKRSIEYIFREIERSKVAVVIFSERYASSECCLHEAKKIYDRRREGKLLLIPVFYRVSSDDVNMFNGRFGECFLETLKTRGIIDHPFAELWMMNVNLICTDTGFSTEEYIYDGTLVVAIVQHVKWRVLRRNLKNIHDIFMGKQQETQEGFRSELLYAIIVAFICYFIIPFVFTDLNFFRSRQWFVASLILFVIRKSFCWILRQPEAEDGFGRETLYASTVAALCYFIIPFVFTDLDFFSSLQWFVSVLVLFVIRKGFRWILS